MLNKVVLYYFFEIYVLTPNRPLAHTSFTYRKLNMDGFSVLNGFLGYVDSTQKIFLKFLHAQGLFRPPDLLHKIEDLGLKVEIQY